MTTESDKSFADAVLRLKLADESSVGECMKTVLDGDAPSLAEAMVGSGSLDAEAAARALTASLPDTPPGPLDEDESPEIDGYEIRQKLGEGGMGCVWLARQTSLDRLVAIKILPFAFSRNKKLVERFRREALATAKLNHPNIVSAIDVGVQERADRPDLYYFVIEYVDGQSLDEILARAGRIEPFRAAQMTREVAVGLEHAWSEAGIVHRDIKPGNILITRGGDIKLTDLGLARSRCESAALTTAGLAIGTPHYASPEQALGRSDVDTRSDIYALGATLFHMLTGRPVFEGDSAAAVMVRHINEDAPACTDVNPKVPRELDAIVARMMQRDPALRYQTPGELRTDIERFISGERPLAYTQVLDAQERVGGAFPTKMPEVFDARKEAGATRSRERRPRHWPHVVGAAVFLAAAGVGLWAATRDIPANRSASGAAAAGKGAAASLWFDLSNPSRVVGSGGSFPRSFGPQSGVRCYVKPQAPAYLYVFLLSADASGAPSGRLLAPEKSGSMPVLTNALTRFPEAGGFYSLPKSAHIVAFIAVASNESLPPQDVSAAVAGMSKNAASAPGLRAALPRGRTLWYREPETGWTMEGETAAPEETVAVLNAVCGDIRKAFGQREVSVAGAATSCEPGG